MKYPTHLILDFSPTTNHQLSPYWVLVYSGLPTPAHLPQTSPVAKPTVYPAFDSSTKYSAFNSLENFNIYFLRKEKIYTKLKYSRCPQYDMVSGGIAALLAGFIGFLITEKFGLELLDSGDFYIAFMYAVFLTFSLRPFLKIICRSSSPYRFISLKFLVSFYKNLAILSFRVIYTITKPFNPNYNAKWFLS
tara:strand:+ start:9736 stop:10308 length:573 start_codon:yes stop_codon:yes gene_type:complete